MAQYVLGADRRQVILLPHTLDEYVDEENPARFIDAFVDGLDLMQLGFKHAQPNEEGRPPYYAGDMLKLYLWGYLNQIRSSRKLERECYRDLEVMWLMKKLTPDFRTIADFRKENVGCIKPVFKEFVYFCEELGMVGGELVSIDGVKLRAVNSIDRNLNLRTLADRMKRVEDRTQRYLNEMEEADEKEGEEKNKAQQARVKGRQGRLRERVQRLREKMRLYSRLLSGLQESGQNEVSLTDPDSRLMKDRGKLDVCYNAHSAVDSKEHIIVEYDVTNNASDNNSLSPMAKSAKETLGVEKLEATADKGFFSQEGIRECALNGITPYVPEPKKSTSGKAKSLGIPAPEFFEDKFVYDKQSNTYTCPAGQMLRFRYWDKKGRGRTTGIYMTDGACFTCPYFMTRCTMNKIGRTIQRWEHEELLEEMKRRMKEQPEKMELRRDLSEHPFGTIKRAFNQGYLLLKGLRKVDGEVGFTMLAYNMRRAINILGTKALIASLG